MSESRTYIRNFFLEKDIPYQIFEIIDGSGYTHLIDTEFVIMAITSATIHEQQVISQTLCRLDFYNQSITDYLKYLAEVLVKRYEKVL